MYLFCDSNGKIPHCDGANSPDVVKPNVPEGITLLYLDDNVYPDVKINYPNYTIVNKLPIFTPISNEIKLPPLQQSKIEEINLACNLDILNGFESSVLGESYHYKFDLEYQNNFSEMAHLLNLDDSITEVNWPTNGLMVPYTKLQFVQLLKDAGAFKSSKMARYFNLKAQILAMTSIDELKEVVW